MRCLGAGAVLLLAAFGGSPALLADDPAAGSPDVEYRRGLELARQERWDEARSAFLAGRRKAPRDKRFLVELAGVAFKQGRSGESKGELHHALRLDPADRYAADFLATIYYLEGNLPAAVKWWNRSGKPRIEEVRTIPRPRVDPVLLDRALRFAPASRLLAADLAASEARLDLLGIFAARRIELAARPDGSFDLTLHLAERSGWGANRTQGLLALARGLPYRTVHVELYNLKHAAINSLSLIRWDPQKQRVATSLALPLRGNPALRFKTGFDARDEEWDVARALHQSGALAPRFGMRTLEATAGIEGVSGSRWRWSSGAALVVRRYRTGADRAAPAGLFTSSPSLEYRSGLGAQLLAWPERRFVLDAFGQLHAARLLSVDGGRYARVDGGLRWRWAPSSGPRKPELSGTVRAGTIVGSVPFDRLVSLGVERDGDLGLRGHAGVADGRKGAGPLGRSFLVVRNQLDLMVYRAAFWSVRLGPFLDAGRARDPNGLFGSSVLHVDAGLEARFSVLDRVGVVLSYGRDLRGGRGAFFSAPW